jgi:hypothetical protein
MCDVKAGSAAFVLDEEAAEALEHPRLASARLHVDNGREPRCRYDRFDMQNANNGGAK